jgi:branched-chain amino acid transport system substrate-binding protein
LRVLIVAAGCGSSKSNSTASTASTSSTSSPGTTATTTATTAPVSGGSIKQATVAAGIAFTGGKAGKANSSLSPITIGYVNEEGTVPSFVEYHATTTAAVNFVNEQLGGIGGHPLKLEACVMQSEEDGLKCAGQLLNAKDIHIGILGLAVVGNASFYKTVNGAFPTVVDVTAVGVDYASPDVYDLDGGGIGVLNAEAVAAKSLNVKTVALLTADNAAGKNTALKIQAPRMKALGITPTVVLLKPGASTPEFASALTSAGAEKAGAIVFNPEANAQCNQLHQALASIGQASKPVVANVFCAADTVIKTTGSGLNGWKFGSFGWNPRVPGNPQSEAYANVMEAAGKSEDINAGYTFKSFADVMAVAKFANEIGPEKITSAAMKEAIVKWRGQGWMIPGTMHCGLQKELTSVCGTAGEYSSYENGAWKDNGPVPLPTA